MSDLRLEFGRGSERRRRRTLVIGVVAGLVVAAGVLFAGGAARADDSSASTYSATIDPTVGAAGATQHYALTVTDSATSTQTLGSANIAVPAAFGDISVLTVTASGGQAWTACICEPGTLELQSDGTPNEISPGQSVSVTFTATTPCSPGDYTWATGADGFTNAGSDPSVAVVPGAVDHFQIALPDALFAAVAGTPFAPTITAFDVCGNVATGFDGSGALSSDLDASPNGTQPTVPGTASFDQGVSQPSVTAVDAEAGRTLTFSSGDHPSVTTPEFAVLPGPADHLEVTQQPLVGGKSSWLLETDNALTQFGAQVTIYDAFGNVATEEDGDAAEGQVALTLHQKGTSGSLGGTTSVTPTAGVASFSGLTVDASSVGYTVSASYSDGVTGATSDPFDVYLTLNDCAAAGTQCGIQQFNVDSDTTTQVQGDGSFAFLGVAKVPFSANGVPAGCQSFAQDETGSAPVVVIDQRSSLSGDLYVTYGISKTLVAKKYGSNKGQQFIPLCVGARRIAFDAGSGTTVPVPCDQPYDGQPQTGWVGKTLDANGLFVPGSTSPAICDANPSDPGYGYFWGIAGSFQDATAPKRSPRIDPAANPTVTSWTSDTTYRYFTLRFPSGSGPAGSPFADVPWDGYCGG